MTPAGLSVLTHAIVHELRTPLSAIAAEVDLALARDRSPDAYRAALARIAECVAELVDITADFTLYGDAPGEGDEDSRHAVRLSSVIETLGTRYGARRGAPVTFAIAAPHGRVAGRDALITGALSLLIEHALRHRRSGSRVILRGTLPDPPEGTIELRLDATPGGFTASAWDGLAAGGRLTDGTNRDLRLHTAAGIICACGGSLALTTADGAEGVLIRLRAAARRPDGTEASL